MSSEDIETDVCVNMPPNETIKGYWIAEDKMAEYEKLEEENAELKLAMKVYQSTLADHEIAFDKNEKCIATTLKERDKLQDKLDSIRYLEWDEVAKALKTPDGEWLDELFDEDDGWGALVTAVCSLAMPEQKYLDKAEVEKILGWFINTNRTGEEFITAICSLAIPKQKCLDRTELEKIFNENYTVPDMAMTDFGMKETGFMELHVTNVIDAICSLAIVDKEKIVHELEHLLFDHVKYYIQSWEGYSDINCGIKAEELLGQVADNIIKAIKGE